MIEKETCKLKTIIHQSQCFSNSSPQTTTKIWLLQARPKPFFKLKISVCHNCEDANHLKGSVVWTPIWLSSWHLKWFGSLRNFNSKKLSICWLLFQFFFFLLWSIQLNEHFESDLLPFEGCLLFQCMIQQVTSKQEPADSLSLSLLLFHSLLSLSLSLSLLFPPFPSLPFPPTSFLPSYPPFLTHHQSIIWWTPNGTPNNTTNLNLFLPFLSFSFLSSFSFSPSFSLPSPLPFYSNIISPACSKNRAKRLFVP